MAGGSAPGLLRQALDESFERQSQGLVEVPGRTRSEQREDVAPELPVSGFRMEILFELGPRDGLPSLLPCNILRLALISPSRVGLCRASVPCASVIPRALRPA